MPTLDATAPTTPNTQGDNWDALFHEDNPAAAHGNAAPDATEDAEAGEPAAEEGSGEEAAAETDEEPVTQDELPAQAVDATPDHVAVMEEHLHKIREARAEARTMKDVYLSTKEDAAAAKKAWESSVDRLGTVIDTEPKAMPLFDQTQVTQEATETTEPSDGPPAVAEAVGDEPAAEAVAVGGPEVWRTVTTEALGLSPGLCEILRDNTEAPILTIGQIADWGGAGKNLTEIPKIGPGKADKISDALEAFWAANPQFTGGKSV